MTSSPIHHTGFFKVFQGPDSAP